MKKQVLIAFILSFGVFVFLCASENITATKVEIETLEIAVTPSVTNYQVHSQQPSQCPSLGDIEATPSAGLETPSPTLSAENTVEPSKSPVTSQGIQEVRIARPKRVLLKPGQSTNFRIFLMPTDITDAKVVFEIEDETIAKLSSCEIPEKLKETSGCTITGLKPGKTVINITVTSEKGNCTDSCIIIVGDGFM